VSISRSLDLAVDRARAIGCECLQIFYGSPRQWRAITHNDEAVDRFVEKRRAARLTPLIAHAAYLINLGAAERVYLRRSVESLLATGPDPKNLARLRRLQGGERRPAPKEMEHERRPVH
jgi:deoxyribonuclease-4